jgi:uncharacterized protein YggE
MEMKQVIITVVLLCAWLSVQAAEDNIPVITVSGVAEFFVVPDEALVSLEVVKLDKDLQKARHASDESVAKIIEVTRRYSVLPRDVQTGNITVEMKYESVRDGKTKIFAENGEEIGRRVFVGYEVSKSVTVRLTDMNRFEEFFAEVLKTGVSEVSGVKLDTSRLRESMDKARQMAMTSAREKAVAMAAAVGQKVGKAIKITEERGGDVLGLNYAANETLSAMDIAERPATFAPGSLAVGARVTVSFRLD